ncbi:septation protein SepH, partial [Puerhibacterium puerhi]|uniref:septation protein SepH n=1 Tax=Puerhibacterium puerhi TaxID=2692623 RepID=UPI0013595EB1
MAELRLVRVREDGEHLVLADDHGTEHVLAVTDALRAAVARRPDRRPDPRPATAGAATATLSPRELQTRMRAGASAEELAAEAGVDVEHVRRFEHPVVAEREHVIGLVRAHQVQGLDGAKELGEIADARLAARGVPADDATWSARREGTAPWVVEVRFAAGDRERSARWTFDLRGRVVTPLDDEARWLGQPDDPLTPDLRGVPSLSARRGPATLDDDTTLLLDDLAGRRGQRPASRPFAPSAPGGDVPLGAPAP